MQTSPRSRHRLLRALALVALLLSTASIILWKSSDGRRLNPIPTLTPEPFTSATGRELLPGIPGDSPSPSNAPKTAAPPQPTSHTGEAAREQLRKAGQYESLGAAFQAARYAAEKIDPAGPYSRGAEYFAANPKQQLRAWFSKDGVELASGLHPKDESAVPWNVALRLQAIGREGSLEPVAATAVKTARSRVEANDPRNGVTQWFENREEGLEQGFTISARPLGDGGELTLQLRVEGSLRAESLKDREGLRFVDADGTAMVHYTKLKAWDATGATLSARMELHDGALALVVNDAGAHYPITVDPLFASVEARFTDESAAGAGLGASGLDGNRAVLGAPFDDTPTGANVGSAYVFLRTGTSWAREAKLTANDGLPGDRVGISVAISGTTVVVGARTADLPGAVDTGCAYVFVGTSWTQQAKLTVSDAAAGDNFGVSVAISGNTVVVGADRDDTSAGVDAGSAQVFLRTGSNWSPQGLKLEARLPGNIADGAASDGFGGAVALHLDTAVIGAESDDHSGLTDAGSAYVFFRSGTPAVWNSQKKLIDSDPFHSDAFGCAVAVNGDYALVGAFGTEENLVAFEAGAVLAFMRTGTSWSLPTKLVAPNAALGDIFGVAVALSTDTAVIGAYFRDAPGKIDSGSAYVFVRSGTVWNTVPQATLTAANASASDLFGYSVAISGDTALIGAIQTDRTAGANTGSGYVYVRSGVTWSQQAELTPGNDTKGFGNAVAASGNTVLVGAPYDDSVGALDSGSAYVFVRSGTSWNVQAKFTDAVLPNTDEFFGLAVALDGDYAVIGAPRNQSGAAPGPGFAVIFARNGTAWTREDTVEALSPASGDQFGTSVALSSTTAVVAAPAIDRAFAYVRAGASWNFQREFVSASSEFAASVAISGDTVLIGDPTIFGAGRAFVFLRTGSAWSQQTTLIASDGVTGDFFGGAVALSGDTALVAASADTTAAGTNAGSAYVFVRSGGAWSQQAKLTAIDARPAERFGSAVAVNGNLALVGTPRAAILDQSNAGAVYVFSRNAAIWSPQVKLTSGLAPNPFDLFGQSVALSGDIAVVGASGDGPAARSAYAFILGELPEITDQPDSRTVVLGNSVAFNVAATGYGPLRYQWRKDGAEINGATGSSYSIASVVQADAGNYDVVVSNVGGVVTSAPALLQVNALSQFDQTPPLAAPSAQGFVFVTLSPAGIGAAWRFVGEQEWRGSGVPATGLTTADRQIEFRPVPGYIQPLRETVSVISGAAATVLDREYYDTPGGTGGGLTMILKPDSIAGPGVPVAQRAQWRLLGEDDSQWRDTSTTRAGLFPGVYLVECKPLPGRTTPPALSVVVDQAQTRVAVATYFLQDALIGTQPVVLPVETVRTSPNLPYAFVGQLRSDVGTASGFVVRPRVVATAGHVVFDDGALSYATGLQWLFQRDRGSYEPKPLLPLGSYVFSGYAAQRTAEASPGTSGPDSQHQDVAAVYFQENAGRDGYSGYLASDATDNEWLLSPRQKILVGYPTNGIALSNQGRMHATPPANIAFSRVPGQFMSIEPYRLYTTTGITSSGGTSGGPLCVQYDDGKYYPAAIYLGGSAQTVVRVIDSRVIDLFDRAQTTATTGNNNNGGGIIQVNSPPSGGAFAPAALTVNFAPASVTGSAKWKISPSTTPLSHNFNKTGLSAGTVTINFTAVSGFLTPPAAQITLLAGVTSTITRTYFGITSQPQDRTVAAFSNATFTVGVSGTPTAYQWRRNGVNIAGATSASYTRTSVTVADIDTYTVVVTWGAQGSQTSSPATLAVTPLAQTINFPALANRLLSDPPLSLGATSSSSLPVVFTVLSGPATLNGASLTPTGYGTVTIRASQSGDGNYAAATFVNRSFQVTGDTLDTWRTRNFTSAELTNSALSGPLADFDRDNSNTLLEFALNLDPKTPDAVTMTAGTGLRGLPLIRREQVLGQPRLTAEYVRRRAASTPGITYSIEFNSNLPNSAGWTPTGTESATQIDETWERVKVTDSQTSSAPRFGRLKVTMP